MNIDLNADMGESFGNYILGQDGELLEYVSSANLACGFHAGDPVVMARTVKLAAAKGVSIGAHPSYPDLQGFGRRSMNMTPEEIEATILYQLGALDGFARVAGTRLNHVKAHGALYNDAVLDEKIAKAYVQAVARFNPSLWLVASASSPLVFDTARQAGLKVLREAFADRAYNADGTLVSRQIKGSMLAEPAQVAAQVVRMVKEHQVIALDGTPVALEADTICIHGDGPHALDFARAVRQALQAENINICAPSN